MSMLRFLSSGGGQGKPLSPTGGDNATGSSSKGDVQVKLFVPNWGILYLPAPEAPREDGDDVPRDDPMLSGDLVVTLPSGGGARRCQAIRVGLKTIIRLDLGQGRRREEDVLFERKVEIVSSTADGIWLSEGSQRFDFTIIVPANLASHDWHTNGVISHILYAEVEGLPDSKEGVLGKSPSSSALFSLRKPRSRQHSRSDSRDNSPPASPPLSPSSMPRMLRTTSRRSSYQTQPASPNTNASSPIANGGSSFSISSALANLSTGGSRPDHSRRSSAASTVSIPEPSTNGANGVNGVNRTGGSQPHTPMGSPLPSPIPIPGGTRVNPAHLSAAQSLSITRQDDFVPPPPWAPCGEEAPRSPVVGSDKNDKSGWIIGRHTAKRNCMVVYNPSPTGEVNELNEQANGYIAGLGVWELRMVSDVWGIGSLLSANIKVSNMAASTTIFSVKLILNQTQSVVSPRDADGTASRVSTREFTILSEGKRPDKGYHYPDKRHPALWRGERAGGENKADSGESIVIDQKCRMPNDIVARPSTLPGVITPITVSHTISLEIAFSVWGEDDVGKAMPFPSHGGLRVLKVSRPVVVPSCCLVPAVLDLPTYESHAKDRLPADAVPPAGLPGWEWCSCGWQIAQLEERMKQSIAGQQTDITRELSGGRGSVGTENDAKMVQERGGLARR